MLRVGIISELLEFVYVLALILAMLPLAYYILCLYCVITYFRQVRQTPAGRDAQLPPISILKPVRGLDREAYENFVSFCYLDYPQYELLFAVTDPDDAVVPIIERLQADFPQASIRSLTDVSSIGTNDKINNLCRLAQDAQYDLLVMSDSDVRVEPDYLRSVVAAFTDPSVGAVTALCRSSSAGNCGSDLEALGMYVDSTPAALAAMRIEGEMGFAFGWTMATSKRQLGQIGGWESMANYHSDDFELGRRIAQCGRKVRLMAEPVLMVFPKQTVRQFFEHELRWSIGLKSVRPLGHWGLVFTHAVLWTFLGAAIAAAMGSASSAVALVLGYISLRLALACTTGAWGLRDRQIYRMLWLVPVRDALTFLAWVKACFSTEIVWRGRTYQVRNRKLLPVDGSRRKIERPQRIETAVKP